MGILDFLFRKSNAIASTSQPPRNAENDMFKNEDLHEFEVQSVNKNEQFYSEYQKMIEAINPHECFSPPPQRIPLSSSEIGFLKYMSGLPIDQPFIAKHWFFNEGFYYPDTIRLFLSQGYLTVSSLPDISKISVAVLKKVLTDKGLIAKGNKKELIAMVLSHFSESDYQTYFETSCKYYTLTEAGAALTCDLPKSITFNLELEDRCVELIVAGKFQAAIDEIIAHDKKIGRTRGIGSTYEPFIPVKDWYGRYIKSASDEIRIYHACLIFSDIIGIPHKTHHLLKRLLSSDFSDELFHIAHNEYITFADRAFEKEMKKLHKEIAPLQRKKTTVSQYIVGLEPTKKDTADFLKFCKIDKTQSGKPFPLSDEEKDFIMQMVLQFNYFKLDANRIRLARLSDRTFNVNYPGCFVGKFRVKNGQGFMQYSKGPSTTKSFEGNLTDLVQQIPKWIDYINWCDATSLF